MDLGLEYLDMICFYELDEMYLPDVQDTSEIQEEFYRIIQEILIKTQLGSLAALGVWLDM